MLPSQFATVGIGKAAPGPRRSDGDDEPGTDYEGRTATYSYDTTYELKFDDGADKPTIIEKPKESDDEKS